MAYSNLEKALALAVGIDLAVPGTNRKVVLAFANQLGRRAVTTAPYAGAVGRAGLSGLAGFARRRPALAAAGTAYGLERIGAFDPIETAIEDEVSRRIEEVQRGGANPIYGTLEDFVRAEGPKVAKRKVSNFNKAIGSAMKAVKKSKSNGKPGTMKNPKATFARIVRVWKAKSAGRKVSTKGETGIISRNIKRYIG